MNPKPLRGLFFPRIISAFLILALTLSPGPAGVYPESFGPVRPESFGSVRPERGRRTNVAQDRLHRKALRPTGLEETRAAKEELLHALGAASPSAPLGAGLEEDEQKFREKYFIEPAPEGLGWIPVVNLMEAEPSVSWSKYHRVKGYILDRIADLKNGDETHLLKLLEKGPIQQELRGALQGKEINVSLVHQYLKEEGKFDWFLSTVSELSGVQRSFYEDLFKRRQDLDFKEEDFWNPLEKTRWDEYRLYLVFFTLLLKDREFGKILVNLLEETRAEWRTPQIKERFIPPELGVYFLWLSRATDAPAHRTLEQEVAQYRRLLERNHVQPVRFVGLKEKASWGWPKDRSFILPGFSGRIRLKGPRPTRPTVDFFTRKEDRIPLPVSEGGAFSPGIVGETPVVFYSNRVDPEELKVARRLMGKEIPKLSNVEFYRFPAAFITLGQGDEETLIGNWHEDTTSGFLPDEFFEDGRPRLLIDPYLLEEVRGNEKYEFDLFLRNHGQEVEVVTIDEGERHFNPANFAFLFVGGKLKVAMNYAPKTIQKLPFKRGVLITPDRPKDGMRLAYEGGSYGCLTGLVLPSEVSEPKEKPVDWTKVWQEEVLMRGGVDDWIPVFRYHPDFSGLDRLRHRLTVSSLSDQVRAAVSGNLLKVEEATDPAEHWLALHRWINVLNENVLIPMNRVILIRPIFPKDRKGVMSFPVHKLEAFLVQPSDGLNDLQEWWQIGGEHLPLVYFSGPGRQSGYGWPTGIGVDLNHQARLLQAMAVDARWASHAQGKKPSSKPTKADLSTTRSRLLRELWPANMKQKGLSHLARMILQEARREQLRQSYSMHQIMPRLIRLAVTAEVLKLEEACQWIGIHQTSQLAGLFKRRSGPAKSRMVAAGDLEAVARHAAMKAAILERLQQEGKPGDWALYDLIGNLLTSVREAGLAREDPTIRSEVNHQVMEQMAQMTARKKGPSHPLREEMILWVASLSPKERCQIAQQVWKVEFTKAVPLEVPGQRVGALTGQADQGINDVVVQRLLSLASQGMSGLEEPQAKAQRLGNLIDQVEGILAEEERRGAGHLRKTITQINQTNPPTYFTQGGIAYLGVKQGDLVVIGDLHGDFKSLELTLAHAGYQLEKPARPYLCFLGDYGDVGKKSLEVALKILDLKVKDPDHIILLGGNHDRDRPSEESKDVQEGTYLWFFRDLVEILGKEEGDALFDRWTHLARQMPVLLVTANGIAVAHTAPPQSTLDMPGYGERFDSEKGLLGITGKPSLLDQMAFNLVDRVERQEDRPNDPDQKPFLGRLYTNLQRGFWIGRQSFENFFTATGAKVFVRGHDRFGEVKKTQFESRVLTVIGTDHRSRDYGYKPKDNIVARYAKFDLSRTYDRINPHEAVYTLWPAAGLEELGERSWEDKLKEWAADWEGLRWIHDPDAFVAPFLEAGGQVLKSPKRQKTFRAAAYLIQALSKPPSETEVRILRQYQNPGGTYTASLEFPGPSGPLRASLEICRKIQRGVGPQKPAPLISIEFSDPERDEGRSMGSFRIGTDQTMDKEHPPVHLNFSDPPKGGKTWFSGKMAAAWTNRTDVPAIHKAFLKFLNNLIRHLEQLPIESPAAGLEERADWVRGVERAQEFGKVAVLFDPKLLAGLEEDPFKLRVELIGLVEGNLRAALRWPEGGELRVGLEEDRAEYETQGYRIVQLFRHSESGGQLPWDAVPSAVVDALASGLEVFPVVVEAYRVGLEEKTLPDLRKLAELFA